MNANRFYLLLAVLALLRAGIASAQQPAPSGARALESRSTTEPEAARAVAQDPGGIGRGINVPRLIKLSGSLKTVAGMPLTGTHGLTLALYKEQQDGAPLWQESQNVELDEQGRYTVLLGSTKTEGVPVDLFRADEPRWLGVQVQLPGYQEEPRVLLVSVPFALKAVDAETLGGRPPSAFVQADQVNAGVLKTVGAPGAVASVIRAAGVTGGTPGALSMFYTDSVSLVSSVVTQTNGNVGINTTSTPELLTLATLGVNNPKISFGPTGSTVVGLGGNYLGTGLYNDGNMVFRNDAGANFLFGFNGLERVRITNSGNVGIGTTTPGATLETAGQVNVNGARNPNSAQPALAIQSTADAGSFDSTGNGSIRFEATGWSETRAILFNAYKKATQTAGTPNTYLFTTGNTAYGFNGNPYQYTAGAINFVSNTGLFEFRSAPWEPNGSGANTDINWGTAQMTLDNAGNATVTGNLTAGHAAFTSSYNSYFTGNVGIGTTTPAQKLEVDGSLLIGPANSGSGIIFPDGTTQTSACGALGFSTSPESVTQRVKPHEIHLVNNGQSCSYVIEPPTFHTLMDMISQHEQSIKDLQTDNNTIKNLQADNAAMKQTIQELQGQVAELRKLMGAKDK
jgi:hypothetical protein